MSDVLAHRHGGGARPAPAGDGPAGTARPVSNGVETGARAARLRVLVIDDDPDAVLVMQHILGRLGQMAVTTVTGPAAALSLLKNTTFDVVVTDVQMPAMTGLELLHLLRRTAPHLPVIVVTSQVGVDSAIQVLRSRAAAFLFKPLDPRMLLRTVTEVAGAAASSTEAPATPA